MSKDFTRPGESPSEQVVGGIPKGMVDAFNESGAFLNAALDNVEEKIKGVNAALASYEMGTAFAKNMMDKLGPLIGVIVTDYESDPTPEKAGGIEQLLGSLGVLSAKTAGPISLLQGLLGPTRKP